MQHVLRIFCHIFVYIQIYTMGITVLPQVLYIVLAVAAEEEIEMQLGWMDYEAYLYRAAKYVVLAAFVYGAVSVFI